MRRRQLREASLEDIADQRAEEALSLAYAQKRAEYEAAVESMDMGTRHLLQRKLDNLMASSGAYKPPSWAVVKEGRKPRRRSLAEALHQVGPSHIATWDNDVIDSAQLIEFADLWASLGNAIQDQVKAVMDDSSAEVNPNALEEAQRTIGSWHQDIDVALAEALDRPEDDADEDDGSWAYAQKVNR